ncbi:MAG TPA: caspase family protein [Mycobacteriales bacterium]|nr:caspase family protein [Mycobacteriales bacterium]
MSRRTPGWLVEATAWTAALVLATSVAVVASGVIQRHETAVQAQAQVESPVLVDDAVAPPQPKGYKGSPRPVPVVKAGGRSGVGLRPISSLGPPPGIVKDLVPSRFALPEDRWALLVGITDYRSPTHDTLAGANDVAFIRAYLLSAGWHADHIRVITNKAATGKAMRAGLAWLAARSTPGTFALFHYSGHVKQEGGHEKLWPYDRAFINDTELAATLKPTRGKLWVDIAGCEAAGFLEDLPSARVLVSTSSKRTQKSYEHPHWRESVWVGLLWDAGMNQRQADLDKNALVTVGESLRFASYWAEVVTYYQRPHGRQTPRVAGMPVRGWTLADPPA